MHGAPEHGAPEHGTPEHGTLKYGASEHGTLVAIADVYFNDPLNHWDGWRVEKLASRHASIDH